MISSLSKYWRPITRDEYLDKMDIIDTQNACKVSAMPKEIIDEIWKVRGDKNYLEMMRQARAGNGK